MDINLTFLGQMVSFAILVWFTTKFIWPQLNHAIEERQRRLPTAWPPPKRRAPS